MKGLSIRWKLTLWYGLVLAIVLAVCGAAVYVTMRHELLTRADELGFKFVTIDLEGFRTGSMNELVPLELRRQYSPT